MSKKTPLRGVQKTRGKK